jgi:DNA-binding XRE family transcriptional regulator
MKRIIALIARGCGRITRDTAPESEPQQMRITFRALLKMAFPLPSAMVVIDSRPNETEIAARFRALRQKALITQLGLAGLIGVGRQAVNRIENARAMPHQTTWDRFCELERNHNRPRVIFPERWT